MEAKKKLEPRTGRLLISEPHLNDFYFSRAVVLLADHGEDGSVGLILNKPLGKRFNELVKGFPSFDAPVYLGGPVQTDSLFFIHTLGDQIEGSSPIMEGIYWGGDLEQVHAMIQRGVMTSRHIRFFAGYSGWSPNQLDEELQRHSWIVCNTTFRELIRQDPGSMWLSYLRNLGEEYAIWSNFPSDPALN